MRICAPTLYNEAHIHGRDLESPSRGEASNQWYFSQREFAENFMNVTGPVRSFLMGSHSWEQFSILLARVSLGIFFAISGGKKLFVDSRTRQMYETLAGAGIPFPHFMTYFTSSVEFVGRCLLVIGLLSSLCSVALIIQMVVAIMTVRLATIPSGTSFLDWLDDFLYLPEALYIIIAIWLICSGPGRMSVDNWIFRTGA
jgi:putative oxidoreductase